MIEDDSPDVLTDLGVCYRELKRPERALELFDRASSLAPDHWQSRYNAAVVKLFDLDDPAAAQEDLARLKQLAPQRRVFHASDRQALSQARTDLQLSLQPLNQCGIDARQIPAGASQ